MIIVKLMGGLGNQMFQHAYTILISNQYKGKIIQDLSFYYAKLKKNTTPRLYLLNKFNIQAYPFVKKNIYDTAFKSFSKIGVTKYLNDDSFSDPLNHPFTYLDGYWQRFDYLEKIRDILLSDFKLINEDAIKKHKHYNAIIKNNSVAIHIRRGDYVSSDKTSKIHGLCDLDYYKNAIKLTSEKVLNPHFFIFSDDYQWINDNFSFLDNKEIISPNDSNPEEDLILMSKCANFIIANSSYSWWAAWLATNPNKMVISPKKWVNDSSHSTNNLIPKNWISL
ncbi:MAG: alpha-1,2-fucosyltransferase [Flavobacteriales bacterium]|nr:alpha-1,2-fucosyltransferase [Flavobacteriales bacterium]